MPAAEDDAGGAAPGPARRRRLLPWWAQLVLSLGLLAVCVALLLPRLPSGRESVETLRGLSVPLAVLALVLEAASLACYSLMTAMVFARPRVPYGVLVRIDLTTTGLSHVLPAGGATAAGLRLALLRRTGTRTPDVLAGAAVEATASNLVLGCVFLVGVLLLVPGGNHAAAYVLAAVLVGLVLLFVTASGMLVVRRGGDIAGWLAAHPRHLPLLTDGRLSSLLRDLARRLEEMLRHPSRTGRLLGWAAANWVLDAAVLWVMLAATGHRLGLGPLLVGYGLANLLAVLPITPGGLGVVEGVLVPTLVGFGVPGGAALVAVLGWRLWQFWLPIPVAAGCYASLRFGRFALGPVRTGADRRLVWRRPG